MIEKHPMDLWTDLGRFNKPFPNSSNEDVNPPLSNECLWKPEIFTLKYSIWYAELEQFFLGLILIMLVYKMHNCRNLNNQSLLSASFVFAMTILLSPLLIITLLLSICYRFMCQMYLKLSTKHFVSLLEGSDTFWTLDESISKSVINILALVDFKQQDSPTCLKLLKATIKRKLFANLKQKYRKVLYRRKYQMFGYPYWVNEPNVDIEQHIKLVKTETKSSSTFKENELKTILSELSNLDLPYDNTSNWEILLLDKTIIVNGDHLQPVLVRIHHSLGDGFALIDLFSNVFTDLEIDKFNNGELVDERNDFSSNSDLNMEMKNKTERPVRINDDIVGQNINTKLKKAAIDISVDKGKKMHEVKKTRREVSTENTAETIPNDDKKIKHFFIPNIPMETKTEMENDIVNRKNNAEADQNMESKCENIKNVVNIFRHVPNINIMRSKTGMDNDNAINKIDKRSGNNISASTTVNAQNKSEPFKTTRGIELFQKLVQKISTRNKGNTERCIMGRNARKSNKIKVNRYEDSRVEQLEGAVGNNEDNIKRYEFKKNPNKCDNTSSAQKYSENCDDENHSKISDFKNGFQHFVFGNNERGTLINEHCKNCDVLKNTYQIFKDYDKKSINMEEKHEHDFQKANVDSIIKPLSKQSLKLNLIPKPVSTFYMNDHYYTPLVEKLLDEKITSYLQNSKTITIVMIIFENFQKSINLTLKNLSFFIFDKLNKFLNVIKKVVFTPIELINKQIDYNSLHRGNQKLSASKIINYTIDENLLSKLKIIKRIRNLKFNEIIFNCISDSLEKYLNKRCTAVDIEIVNDADVKEQNEHFGTNLETGTRYAQMGEHYNESDHEKSSLIKVDKIITNSDDKIILKPTNEEKVPMILFSKNETKNMETSIDTTERNFSTSSSKIVNVDSSGCRNSKKNLNTYTTENSSCATNKKNNAKSNVELIIEKNNSKNKNNLNINERNDKHYEANTQIEETSNKVTECTNLIKSNKINIENGIIRNNGKMSDNVKNLHVILPIPFPEERNELKNNFSVCMFKLPINNENNTNIIHQRYLDICNSFEIIFNHLIMNYLLSFLPNFILGFLSRSIHSTLVFSNMIGPKQKMKFGGYDIKQLVFFVPNKDSTGVGITLLSYNNQIGVGIIVDASLVIGNEDTLEIIQHMLESVDQMYAECVSSIQEESFLDRS